ncbi:hypothetical protein PQR34_20905 [Paraburkholderia sediminicola]|uniref:hypothetical protein n=1 Tax=Paraburkholderia sediminicola TaxID=458836 RepID=UPI0038B9AAF0
MIFRDGIGYRREGLKWQLSAVILPAMTENLINDVRIVVSVPEGAYLRGASV